MVKKRTAKAIIILAALLTSGVECRADWGDSYVRALKKIAAQLTKKSKNETKSYHIADSVD